MLVGDREVIGLVELSHLSLSGLLAHVQKLMCLSCYSQGCFDAAVIYLKDNAVVLIGLAFAIAIMLVSDRQIFILCSFLMTKATKTLWHIGNLANMSQAQHHYITDTCLAYKRNSM